MFSGAIFDVDGTILDSMRVWEDMTARFLKKYDIELTAEMVEAYRNMTLEVSLPLIVSTFGLDIDEQSVFEEFNRMALEEYTQRVPAKPGAVEYIQRLSDAGVKIAVATSGFPDACKGAFTRLGIAQYIDAYAFSSEVGVDKSNPDVYLLAAQRIGIEPADCMVFEDILAGIKGATLAGMQTTAVYDLSNRSETDALRQCAGRYITDWSELDDFTA